MIDRPTRWILGTAALLLVLTGLRIAQQNRPAEALWAVPGEAAKAVHSIDLSSDEASLALRRSGEGWSIEGSDARVDADRVALLLGDWVDGFAPDGAVGEARSEEELARFGLDSPHRMELVLRGATTRAVWLGKALPGGSHFVCAPQSSDVFRGRVPGASRLATDEAAWTDRRLLPFEPGDVTELTLRRGGETTRFVRSTQGQRRWAAADPAGFVGSPLAAEAMVRSLASFKPKAVLPADEAEAARAAGEVAGDLSVEAVAGARWTLRFGASGQGDGILTLDGDPRVLIAPAAMRAVFDKSQDDLRDRTVVAFERDGQTRIEVRRGPRRLVLEPSGDRGWKLADRSGGAVGATELSLAANSLRDLQAVALTQPPPDLGPAPLVISIQGASSTQLLRIDDRSPNGPFPAAVEGRDGGFIVRAGVVQRLRSLLED